MIISYVSTLDKECYLKLKNDFTDVKNFDTIEAFINFYATSKNRDVILLYRVNSAQEIQNLSKIHFGNNIYMIVIGENNIEHSLLAGKIGVDSYVNYEDSNVEKMKELISLSKSVIKKRKGKSNVSVFTGISGGVGTTTITMNLAKNIAQNHPEKNILFLDFAYTKAISNLFFEHVQPPKTIIDIAMVQNYSLEELFENGLEKYNNNLYFVPGIQKHTDREFFDKAENIQRFLNLIDNAKNYFDIVFIDVGMFEDVELEIDIQELADNIFVVTEFSIPSMSILKTYIDIIDKSGWYNKTHIIANRSDSFGNITEDEAEKILSKGLKHRFKIDFSLPNDAKHLRECWNEATLVNDVYPESRFVKKLQEMGEKFFVEPEVHAPIHTDEVKGFMQRLRKWL
jgi:Flp pilus assembly CpaE family ATPase